MQNIAFIPRHRRLAAKLIDLFMNYWFKQCNISIENNIKNHRRITIGSCVRERSIDSIFDQNYIQNHSSSDAPPHSLNKKNPNLAYLRRPEAQLDLFHLVSLKYFNIYFDYFMLQWIDKFISWLFSIPNLIPVEPCTPSNPWMPCSPFIPWMPEEVNIFYRTNICNTYFSPTSISLLTR